MKAAILSLKTNVGLRRGGRRKEEREDEEGEVPATGERAPLIEEGRTNRDPQSQRRALTTPRLFSLARCNRTVVFKIP